MKDELRLSYELKLAELQKDLKYYIKKIETMKFEIDFISRLLEVK